ncbi:MAG TPA: amino acid adenylation domain-containing protein [Bryobacteraceae bacterium]|nr:amino acid adenylation domain-containing protein [Bryobacteraceae bacterium]
MERLSPSMTLTCAPQETSATASETRCSILAAFYRHSQVRPDATALVVNGTSVNYRELAGLARRISGWLDGSVASSGRVGILASRSVEAYAGVLGALWSGAAYVPIGPKTPEDRLIHILRATKLDALIVDAAGAAALSDRVLENAPRRILAGNLSPSLLDAANRADIAVGNLFDLPERGPQQPVPVAEDALAYIMFTSGSTGMPKGVMIETGSVMQMVGVMQRRYGFRADDRVSGAAELTFDPSVFTMFMAWSAGASLHVVPESQLMAPGKFIKEQQLTIWNSAPSTALFMQRIGMLSPGAFPQLRYSIFGGESLPLALAQAWQAAAPNSFVENLYGPTEATVQCTGQRLADPPNVTEGRGTLAIGPALEGVTAEVVDADLNPVSGSGPGELLVSGKQLARGYLNDPELTAVRFPVLRGARWYRTGDLVYRDGTGAFHHLGRIDNQVKVLGNRVELEEVEAHLRAATRTDLAVAIAWPVIDGRASGIVAFLCSSRVDANTALEAMRKRVPGYMVPREIRNIETMPLLSSGKIDRTALFRRLEEEKDTFSPNAHLGP